MTVDDALGEPFGDRCLADPGLSDEKRIVLAPSRQDLNDALDFMVSSDEGVDLPGLGELIEVACKALERRGARALPVCRGLLLLLRRRLTAFGAPETLDIPWAM